MNEPALIETPAALDDAFARSYQEPVFVFKHSLVCPVSSSAWTRFEAFAHAHAERAHFFVLKIQKVRPLSNDLAERTGVRHESPQALLLREGKAVWHTSHGGITAAALAEALAR